MSSTDIIQKILMEFLPNAFNFISDEKNKQLLDFVVKTTNTAPTIDSVEYDEDSYVVYIKVRLEPKLGTDIKQYAEVVDTIAQQFLELINTFIQSRSQQTS